MPAGGRLRRSFRPRPLRPDADGWVAAAAAVSVASLTVHMWRHAKRIKRTIEGHLQTSTLKSGAAAFAGVFLFTLLHEARRYGARAALFGRKINNAEHQLTFIQHLRRLADCQLEPAEAVRAYHAVLEKLGIQPHRSLEDDLTFQTNVMSYGGNGTTLAVYAALSGAFFLLAVPLLSLRRRTLAVCAVREHPPLADHHLGGIGWDPHVQR